MQSVFDTLDDRLPGRGDDVFGHAHCIPRPFAVAGLDVDAGLGGRGSLSVQDADFEIDQMETGDLRVMRRQGFSQGLIEGVRRAYAQTGRVHLVALDLHADDGFGIARRADPDAVIYRLEKVTAATERAPGQQSERGLGVLEGIAFVLTTSTALTNGARLLSSC